PRSTLFPYTTLFRSGLRTLDAPEPRVESRAVPVRAPARLGHALARERHLPPRRPRHGHAWEHEHGRAAVRRRQRRLTYTSAGQTRVAAARDIPRCPVPPGPTGYGDPRVRAF